ncbi:MAG: hypothetical protein VKJ24_14325 [Synechococcales bacterium]|nr:hypothetical protein [Synechococcales bacterium]
MWETRNDAQARKDWKFRLTRRLYEQGYERQDILNLFRFLDWILDLPEALKQAFRRELEQYEQEHQMPYVTSIEQMGIQKGTEQGREEERKAIARNLLREGFPLDTIARTTGLSLKQLQELQAAIAPQS